MLAVQGWTGSAVQSLNPFLSVMDRIGTHQAPLLELRWLYSRITTWDEPQLAGRIAQEMLPRLLAAGREGEALQLVEERLKADPECLAAPAQARYSAISMINIGVDVAHQYRHRRSGQDCA